ncbi:hypothetical protein IO702_003240 [Vibrio parahaemolyticus]|nr:hypothetical protein [Vibrio parahaemolyticus]
MRCINWFNHLR